MEKLYSKSLNKEYYREVLDNGLTVIIFHKPGFISSSCAFGTPYGALQIHQKLNDKEYNFNPGVAHFLEHKLFETEEKSIMDDFSAIGCNVNAFTSYSETVYFFSTSNSDINEPLNMLLDFVQDFKVTEKSVEKEKGIICEEVMMYYQNPSSRLINETFKSMYHEYPLKFDIGGEKEDILKITKEELETCYKINYHPSNMVLTITSGIDPGELIEIVKDNQKNKSFVKTDRPLLNNKQEPFTVVKDVFEFVMPINVNKQLIAYKLKPFDSIKEAIIAQTALSFALEMCLSPLNPDYQKWLDEGLINDYFEYDLEFTDHHAYVLFTCENDDLTVLDKVLKEALDPKNINEDLCNQLKRKAIGSFILKLNGVEDFNIEFIRDYLSGINSFDVLDIIQNIDIKDIKESLDFVNRSSKTTINMIRK